MLKLELLTKQALESIVRRQSEVQAADFLHRNFGVLSEQEVQALTQSTPPERDKAIQSVLHDLEGELQNLKAGDLEDFVQDKFWFLDDEEQRDFMVEFSRPLLQFGFEPTQERLHIKQLVDLTLGIVPLVMERGEAREYLETEFPSLMEGDIERLTHPVVAVRQNAMDKIVRQLGEEARDYRMADLDQMLMKRLPLNPGEAERIFPDIVPEIVRKIPPRRPKQRPKPRPKPKRNENEEEV